MAATADISKVLLRVLQTGEPSAKALAAREAALTLASSGMVNPTGWPTPPRRPARPTKPELVPPGKVERRGTGTSEGRVALLHALAHIEFNAIDLAFDMALRFARSVAEGGLNATDFVNSWVAVGADEGRHFLMICERLAELGAGYGDLPAHDGLWKTAEETADDVLARLAVAPMALEARGLDVTPGLAEKLERTGDERSAAILRRIYYDEIGHVSVGVRWFKEICASRRIEPEQTFRGLISARLMGGLKPPFNVAGRTAAGLDAAFYG